MNLNTDSSVPLYEQIHNQIRTSILHGKFGHAGKLPSEKEMSLTFNVSRITIRKALELLTKEGLVTKVQGKGSFAGTGEKFHGSLESTRSFSSFVTGQGKKSTAQILKREIRNDEAAAKRLHLDADNDLVYIKRVLLVDDEPFILDSAWYDAQKFTSIITRINDHTSVYELLEKEFHEKIGYSRKELNVTMPTTEQSEELQISTQDPLFSVNKTTFNQKDEPIEYSHLLVRGDKMTYTIESGQSYFKMN
ncbi:GntR family transcriptional regulator [Pediococcus siamensis]|uniref:GntR family transcriptional regulator n=1 Tax=Pediococcus siamensis TaxID=381829 RepID=UPI00399F0A9C